MIGDSVVEVTARQVQAGQKERGTRKNIRNWRVIRNRRVRSGMRVKNGFSDREIGKL